MRHVTLAAAALAAATLLFGCAPAAPDRPAPGPGARKVRVGFSMDTLKEERWQRDRDLFVKRAEALGAEVLVQAANGDDRVQVQQAENLLTQGVDVLVVVPHNADVSASIAEAAERQGVPVIAYDRMINSPHLDLYLSFDSVKIGELQARYLLDRAPKGNYVIIGGAPTDSNARLYHEGQMNVLRPAVERGDVRIVADQFCREWLASEALNHTENALTQNRNDVQAVVATNDGTAGGVVQALEGQGLAGRVLVSGQDAELAALQRIMRGTQAMTIYTPIELLAGRAAEAAVALARGEPVSTSATIDNGSKAVPAVLLEPVVVDRGNIRETVVRDGYHTAEAIGLD